MTPTRYPRFESVFQADGVSQDGEPRFRIRGSGVQKFPTHAPLTRRIVQHLESKGITVDRRSWGSPANVDSHHLDALFLYGRFHAKTGNYWIEPRGAWVEGEDAVTWLAHGLGLMAAASLRRMHPPRPSDALRAAYAATDFVVLDARHIHLEIGKPTPEALLQRMQATQVVTAAIVTAWNPFSQPLAEVENRLRQKQLQHDLRDRGLDTLPAEGRDRQGQWPVEASLLAFGLTREDARELLVRYQQHALVWITEDQPVELMFHAS